MGHAYTPGLRVTEQAWIKKVRRLPLPGKILVELGQKVSATDIVAATELPGPVTTINVAREMNCQPEEVPQFMIKKVGEYVEAGEVIAEAKAFFGLFHSYARAPVSGTIESISEVTGQVLLRGAPTPVRLEAYIGGTVTDILGNEGVVIETGAAQVQGIFGLGGETHGEIKIICESPEEPVAVEAIKEDCRGKVLVGGSAISLSALQRALEVGAKAVVVGAVRAMEIDELLGYHLGVAVTGHEQIGLTLIITEGFGQIPMAQRTFGLLQRREGQMASVNGATQIRAGVIRPEVIIPDAEIKPLPEADIASGLLAIGSPIRLIREPYFGLLATVTALPEEPETIPTEARVRVLRARLADGTEVTVPRANVELIEQ